MDCQSGVKGFYNSCGAQVRGRARQPRVVAKTVKEHRYQDLTLEFYYTVMVPTKTRDAIVSVLQTSILSALALPDVQERLKPLDFTPLKMTGPKVDQTLSEASELYAKIIKATCMKSE